MIEDINDRLFDEKSTIEAGDEVLTRDQAIQNVLVSLEPLSGQNRNEPAMKEIYSHIEMKEDRDRLLNELNELNDKHFNMYKNVLKRDSDASSDEDDEEYYQGNDGYHYF